MLTAQHLPTKDSPLHSFCCSHLLDHFMGHIYCHVSRQQQVTLSSHSSYLSYRPCALSSYECPVSKLLSDNGHSMYKKVPALLPCSFVVLQDVTLTSLDVSFLQGCLPSSSSSSSPSGFLFLFFSTLPANSRDHIVRHLPKHPSVCRT